MEEGLRMLLFLSSELWLLGCVRGASIQQTVGDQLFHWNNWQPWVCMCELHKQARIRHFVVSAENVTVNLKTGEFWEEKACSLLDCIMCKPEECPGSPRLSGFLPQFEHLSVSKPSNANPPPMSVTDFESYESLPVVDDTGEK
ncbi:protein tyrosine phosphatase type IVA 2 [Platysternon megacephalum]|uniref:Protein tyrosine phosphatase type IVA 2 n=1 Tax=Platysternon megacephalum TaxID=55544 RepID=A0A4D9EZS4_9SAUR|nr:protein tyrosine phosphatase type IVA 2 [Platysternon megacephalum]